MRPIDADALIEDIKALEELVARNGYRIMCAYDVMEIIETSPTVNSPEWIPCSERMPENGHYYLWCSDAGSVQSDYYWNGFEKGQKYGYNIVAWMPLPKPYKED